MSALSTTALAFSMSADAFAASIGKGVAMNKPRLRDALQIGSIFGIIETITPIIGWVAGLAASSLIQSVDHWIAFTILAVVGGKMIVESLAHGPEEEVAKPGKHSFTSLVFTAVGTSIDAMAVGASMAFLDMNIWISALAIGAATFLMVTIGIMTGHYIGLRGGKIAEVLGGFGLVMIGTGILFEHLGVF